jgi:sporulation protein YlmC with PRC-barrel domain
LRLLVFLLLASITLVGCNASSDTAGKKVGEVEDLEIIVSENRLKSTKVKVSSSKPIATFPNQVELGIQSILKQDDKVEIKVYALNNKPIAGVQLEINPADIFKIDSIAGGRCGDIDFTLRSNSKGLMLGFSMSGNMVPVSENQIPEDNILFTAYGQVIKNVKNKMVRLESTLAGKGGVKIDVLSKPYEWNGR